MSNPINIPIRIELKKIQENKSQDELELTLSVEWKGSVFGPDNRLRYEFDFYVVPLGKHSNEVRHQVYMKRRQLEGFKVGFNQCDELKHFIFYKKRDWAYIHHLGCVVHDLSNRPGGCKAFEWLP